MSSIHASYPIKREQSDEDSYSSDSFFQIRNDDVSGEDDKTVRKVQRRKEARMILLILTNTLKEKTMMRMARLQDQNQLPKAYHLLEGIITKLGRPRGVPGVHVKDTKAIIQSQGV